MLYNLRRYVDTSVPPNIAITPYDTEKTSVKSIDLHRRLHTSADVLIICILPFVKARCALQFGEVCTVFMSLCMGINVRL